MADGCTTTSLDSLGDKLDLWMGHFFVLEKDKERECREEAPLVIIHKVVVLILEPKTLRLMGWSLYHYTIGGLINGYRLGIDNEPRVGAPQLCVVWARRSYAGVVLTNRDVHCVDLVEFYMCTKNWSNIDMCLIGTHITCFNGFDLVFRNHTFQDSNVPMRHLTILNRADF